VKLLNALTMENIVEAVLADKLAAPEEVIQLVNTLNTTTHDKGTFASVTRIMQVWARRVA
jgi:hypothetical protein